MELRFFKEFEDKLSYDNYINNEPILPNVSFIGEDVYYKNSIPGPEPEPHDYSKDYLTFNILSDGKIYNVCCVGEDSYGDCHPYSKDNGLTWYSDWVFEHHGDGIRYYYIEVKKGDKVLFKIPQKDYRYYHGTSTNFNSSDCLFEVEGNLLSIGGGSFYDDNFPYNEIDVSDAWEDTGGHLFAYLFSGCTGLTSCKNLVLPDNIIGDKTYYQCFAGCTNLVEAPIIPNVYIGYHLYYGDYDYYEDDVTNGFEEMFKGCSKLNKIECLSTVTVGDNNYNNWLEGVSDTGIFIKNKDMNEFVSGVSGIPVGWEVINK